MATDCIGMGLNLPIKTVLFSQTTKFDGRSSRNLTPQEVKQIGGRAGRYGKFECGYIGAINKQSLALISQHIRLQQSPFLESCVVRPTEAQLLVLREKIGYDSIKKALSLFIQLSTPESILICSDLTEMLKLAEQIEIRPKLNSLSFSDKYAFITAPVSSSEILLQTYMSWLSSYSRGIPVALKKSAFSQFSRHSATNDDSILNEAENCVKMLVLYHWLARKKSEHFPNLKECEELKEQVNVFIENSLKKKVSIESVLLVQLSYRFTICIRFVKSVFALNGIGGKRLVVPVLSRGILFRVLSKRSILHQVLFLFLTKKCNSVTFKAREMMWVKWSLKQKNVKIY